MINHVVFVMHVCGCCSCCFECDEAGVGAEAADVTLVDAIARNRSVLEYWNVMMVRYVLVYASC